MTSVVWVVGKWKPCICECSWEMQGVFTDHGKAVAACRTSDYFVGPVEADRPLPDAPTEWPGAYYPLAESVDG